MKKLIIYCNIYWLINIYREKIIFLKKDKIKKWFTKAQKLAISEKFD